LWNPSLLGSVETDDRHARVAKHALHLDRGALHGTRQDRKLVVRFPKIYVVDQHEKDGVLFATLDIDEAFTFAQEMIDYALGKRLSYDLEILELEGIVMSRAWTISVDFHGTPGTWFELRDSAGGPLPSSRSSWVCWAYEHVFGGRRERLIEAAEIVMTIVSEENDV
jgi:hypothetical protein